MKIGFIGLGTMGAPMCMNIIKKHNDTVYVWNRTLAKAEPLAEAGAHKCESVNELAQAADVIITMVSRSEDSKQVYETALAQMGPGKLCIDMSTIDPAVSVQIAEMIKNTGAAFIDAPVVKSKAAAIAGTLGIYVGGDEADYERAVEILSYMGENIIYLGKNGAGLVMKICHNALVSQIQNGVNETLTLAAANGIDVLTFAKAVSYGGGQNAYLDSKKEVLAKEDYAPAFSAENMAKDVNICLNLAKKSGVKMPGEENVKNVYDKIISMGLSKEDFSATIKAVRNTKALTD